jgi:hypothetical protein
MKTCHKIRSPVRDLSLVSAEHEVGLLTLYVADVLYIPWNEICGTLPPIRNIEATEYRDYIYCGSEQQQMFVCY